METPFGTPVLIALNGHSDHAARIKERIEAPMALGPAKRAPVNSLMATTWNSSARYLYDTSAPLAAGSVRSLTPSQALARLPHSKGTALSATDGQALPNQCLPSGALEQFGSPIRSAPKLDESVDPS